MPFFPQNAHARYLSIIFLASLVLSLAGVRRKSAARPQFLSYLSSYETTLTYNSQQNLGQTPDSRSSQFPSTSLINLDTDSLASGEYTSIVVFGASWADNAHPRPKKYAGTLRGSPYYQGRYSNGIIWAEYLSNRLLTGENIPLLDYAYGGAVANNNLTYTEIPDTSTELNQYISDVRNGSINRGYGPVLHFWWIGINQITQIWTDAIKADSTLSMPDILAKASRRVDMQITELQRQVTTARQDLSVNSVPCDFFIIPIPPLETVLTFKYQASDLAKNSKTLAKSFWRDVIANPRQYQFVIPDKACLHYVDGNQVSCSEPDEYVYWDSLHPTTAMHGVIADSLLSAIKD
ncbi:uncharacterized protein MELLADRAFT_102077 [Melampsora larici-populina 98AG31]|uniref:Uncharacterized protein n=1 Tax=Melampsora larici-populina (strain 98AG31 / pathotype 3-4-7) TaxID=747676 RepID=F4R5X7_MELLP|nr:uncharacterized protein MELLADRAFT_102077 [Melampsora larici-populina 98AG31]EGG12115.1 hypothetical protein MELLADRAFT_102077 [Melampsora larici-populina 98AG31]